jgi:hypothetical protein
LADLQRSSVLQGRSEKHQDPFRTCGGCSR